MGAFSLIVVINLLNRSVMGTAEVAKTSTRKLRGQSNPRGRLYVAHLPFGFYHEALQEYYSQFGKVTKVRVERSERTGGYKGYAFVEFESPEIAKIAAESSNNYIMGSKVLKATFLPPGEQHVKRLTAKKTFAYHKTPDKVRELSNCANLGLSKRSLLNKQKNYVKLHKKLAEYGIDYNEAPIDLKLIEKRLKESNGRESRVKKLKRSVELQREAKRKKRRQAKSTDSKPKEPQTELSEIQETENGDYKTKNVIDTFEQALDALKGDKKTTKEQDDNVEKDCFEGIGQDLEDMISESPDAEKLKVQSKTKRQSKKSNMETTEKMSKPEEKAGKKRSLKVDEVSEEKDTETSKPEPSKAKKLKLNKNKISKAPEIITEPKQQSENVTEISKEPLRKKQFGKKETVKSFRHNVKNIQFKYMT